MKIITFGSLKGGVSKTTTALLSAYCLAKAGKKILFIDGDINNSSSWTLTPENKNELDPQNRKHIAAALQGENLLDYVIPSNTEGIDLIPSSLYLVDLRTINQNRFKSLVKSATLHFSLAEKYDYIIIDTAPTYDNITMMFYEASDIIITPTLLSQFDFNTALFLNNKIQTETSVYEFFLSAGTTGLKKNRLADRQTIRIFLKAHSQIFYQQEFHGLQLQKTELTARNLSERPRKVQRCTFQ